MKYTFLIGFFSIALASCSNGPGKQEFSVNPVVIPSPAIDSCAEPFLLTAQDGSVYLSWIQRDSGKNLLRFATLEGDTWTPRGTIAAGSNWFVNWADYPVLCVTGNNHMLAHYLAKSDSATFAYNINVLASADNGRSWGSPRVLHTDGTLTEHGFVSMVPYQQGYFVAWLDGRRTGGEGDEGDHGHHGQMTLRGAFLSETGETINEWELDDRVCDCCQTTSILTDNGPVVIYRNRSDDEIRDMYVVRYADGQWTQPANLYPDNWQITGCPVNGPRGEAIGNTLAVAWFSMEEKTGSVKVIFSRDGGAGFGKPVTVHEGDPIGRVDLVMMDNETACVSWMEGGAIKLRRVTADGTVGDAVTVAQSSAARSAGFPQLTRQGNRLVMAWTDDADRSIKTALLPL